LQKVCELYGNAATFRNKIAAARLAFRPAFC
jgi:hypothetical protein